MGAHSKSQCVRPPLQYYKTASEVLRLNIPSKLLEVGVSLHVWRTCFQYDADGHVIMTEGAKGRFLEHMASMERNVDGDIELLVEVNCLYTLSSHVEGAALSLWPSFSSF